MSTRTEIEMERPMQNETAIDLDETDAHSVHSNSSTRSSQSSSSSSNSWSKESGDYYHERTPSKKVRFKLGVLLFAYLCVLICLVVSLTVKRFSNRLGVVYGVEAWKWFVFVLIVLMGKPVTELAINLLLILAFNLILYPRNRIIYYKNGLKTRIGVVTTLIGLLLTWYLWLRNTHHAKYDPVGRTIITLLVGAIFWLVEGFLLLWLASSFHLTSFFERVQDSIFHQYIIETLSGKPKFKSIQQEVEDGDEEEDHDDIDIKIHRKLKGIGTSTSRPTALHTMQRLLEAVTSSALCCSAVEVGSKSMTIRSRKEAVATACLIFQNVAKPGYRHMEVADFMRFLCKEEVDMVLSTLEVGKNGRITLQAFSKWMEKVYIFREVLTHALADNKKAYNQLTRVLDAILILVIIIIWLVLVKVATGNIIVIIFTQVAATAFIFGDSVKKVFDASIFVFLIHPFDVGDCCLINGTPVIIEKVSILTTTVSKFDQETIYYPNSVLSTMAISNYTRNPHMGDSLEFCIDLMTPAEKIKQLKQDIKRYFKENTHQWKPHYSLVMKDIDGMDKIRMVLNFNHTINFREFTVRKERKSMLISELQQIFKKLQLKIHPG